MYNVADPITDFMQLMQANVHLTLAILAVLWGINIINWVLGSRLNYLGIYPRSLLGLPGIFFSPILHGDFNHLFFNSIPLFVLMNFILIGGVTGFVSVSLFIIVTSGLAVWLFGRKAIHIGASSLIMGYFAYVLLYAYIAGSMSAIVVAIVAVYYFGGMIFSIVPTELRVSWEGHLFGFIAGILAAYYQAFI